MKPAKKSRWALEYNEERTFIRQKLASQEPQSDASREKSESGHSNWQETLRAITRSRSFERCYERLNFIAEGSYGIVFRARELETGKFVAVKRVKLEKETEGFPISSLREINVLLQLNHPSIVRMYEVCIGETFNQVYLIMEFVEHDLRSLIKDMPLPFLMSEIKTIMLQMFEAISHMHRNWILHRDLKSSNILITNRGRVKVADFGLARSFADPLPDDLTQLVVTLWYRAPELLLGASKYTTSIDVWSVGCIFAELVTGNVIFQGKSEIDQIIKIFQIVGPPTKETWPDFEKLPHADKIRFPLAKTNLKQFIHAKYMTLTSSGIDLLSCLLHINPSKRISASAALGHKFFTENPMPKHPDMFPSFPSKSKGEKSLK